MVNYSDEKQKYLDIRTSNCLAINNIVFIHAESFAKLRNNLETRRYFDAIAVYCQHNPASTYLFTSTYLFIENIRTRCEICSKLTIRKPGRRQ